VDDATNAVERRMEQQEQDIAARTRRPLLHAACIPCDSMMNRVGSDRTLTHQGDAAHRYAISQFPIRSRIKGTRVMRAGSTMS